VKKKRIVTIGGGTGSYTLLSGLKKYPVDLTAIVSMADDGGSTGRLRDELGVLPPGDVRQCLVALSESSKELRELMNYRFENGDLRGHSFGNLLLSALEKINGSFAGGVEQAMKLLNVRGEVVPVTDNDAKLRLKLMNQRILEGEDEINHADIQASGVKKMWYVSKVGANEKALRRIAQADAIVIGPGNQYCSILPSLVIKEVSDALQSAKGKIIYVCNLTNKKGHTLGWGAKDYVQSIEEYIGEGRVDFVLHNTQKPKTELLNRYIKKEGKGLLVSCDESDERIYRVVRSRVVSGSIPKKEASDAIASTRSFIRHDSDKLAKAIMLLLEWEGQRVIEDIV